MKASFWILAGLIAGDTAKNFFAETFYFSDGNVRHFEYSTDYV